MNDRCESVTLDLDAFVRGILEPSRAGQINAHVAECADCNVELEGARRVSLLLERHLTDFAVSKTLASSFANRLAAEAMAEEERAESSWSRWTRPATWISALTTAAAAAVIAMVSWPAATGAPTQVAVHPEVIRPAPVSPPITVRRVGEGNARVAREFAAIPDVGHLVESGMGVPPELAENPDLFVDFAIIRELDLHLASFEDR